MRSVKNNNVPKQNKTMQKTAQQVFEFLNILFQKIVQKATT